MNPERQFLPEQSIEIAMQTLAMMNLRIEFRDIGANIKTYHCKLIDDDNKKIFYGCGKGLGLQSQASAFYEALEHYFIHRYASQAGSNTENYLSFRDARINAMFPELVRHYGKITLAQQEKLPFVSLLESGSDNKIHYPLFLLDPRYAKRPPEIDGFNYQPLAWLASDSGTASGTSRLEAGIHALNELIERDAYSLFLLRAFVSRKHHGIRLIDKNSVPAHLKTIILEIETKHQDDLMIFDITSDIGVPTVLVSMTKQNHLFQPKGCGTSLDREYALERALLESLQPVHIYNDELFANQQAIVCNYQRAPLLLDCAKADVAAIAGKCAIVSFDTLPDHEKGLSLRRQYATITGLIRKRGLEVYHTTIAELPTGFSCVRYVVPELEQFYLVQTGKFILPGKRGQSILAMQSQPGCLMTI